MPWKDSSKTLKQKPDDITSAEDFTTGGNIFEKYKQMQREIITSNHSLQGKKIIQAKGKQIL